MISILKREADKCQDPADQAEILKHAAGLKNLIVQLKILVSSAVATLIYECFCLDGSNAMPTPTAFTVR